MKKDSLLVRVVATLVQLGLIMVAYVFIARPYQLQWGATTFEISRSMPGDERRGNPDFLATRAITIEGTPEKIWPWLIQMGYGRAGFYGYDIVENLGSKSGIQSANRILPEFQIYRVGEEVPLSPVARLYFYEIEPDNYLVWSEDKGEYPGAFTWALYPVDEHSTRLVSRIGWSYHWSEPGLLALDIFTEFTDHIAVRGILQGVKGRVEGHSDNFAANSIEFTVYLFALLLFVFSLIISLLRPITFKNLGIGLLSGAIWLITWYTPIPLWVGAILVFFVFLGYRIHWGQTGPGTDNAEASEKMNDNNILKRWPIGGYFILAFSISWGGTFALGLGDFLRGVELDLESAVPIAIIMLAGPLVTGIAMTWITEGRAGVRDLFRRVGKWRVSGRWYLALWIFPSMILAVQVPLSLWYSAEFAPILNPIGILGGLMAGFQEEIGWIGFAYSKMRLRFGVLKAGIFLGVIHAVWHAPADFIGNFNTMQMAWLPYFLGFSVFIVALRIIIVWIYENTGSLLLAMLAHTFSTGFLGFLVPTANPAAIWPVFYAVYAVLLWVIAARILFKDQKRMAGQPARFLVPDH